MYYFYKTTNIINGKYYYGSGSKKDYIGSGLLLREAVSKYGIENFKTDYLKYFKTREEAYKFEERFLHFYDLKNDTNSYNLTNNGNGGNQKDYNGVKSIEYREHSKRVITEWNTSEEAKEISRKRMLENNPMQNEESRNKSINALNEWRKTNKSYWLGRNIPEDTRKKISETRKAKKMIPYNKGVLLEKTEICEKCSRVFTKPGIKKHLNTCKI